MARTRKGFTLIELLVVVAIIAILAAILFPVFTTARAKALQTTCSSNMRQIVIALLNYASDWEGTLPGLNALGQLEDPALDPAKQGPLWRYVNKSRGVLTCPVKTWVRNWDQSKPNQKHEFKFTYTINGWMTLAPQDRDLADIKGEKLSKSKNAARTILLVDENCDETKNEEGIVVNDMLFIWKDRTGDRHPGSEHLTTINGTRYLCSGVAPVGYLDSHMGVLPGLIKWNSEEGQAIFCH